MRPHDRVRFQHALDAASAAKNFALNRSRGDLDTDDMLLFALVRAIEVIGEALSKVSDETRAETDLPWASIIGMRNRLIRAYFDISRDILWTTVTEAIPPLAQKLQILLKNDDGSLP